MTKSKSVRFLQTLLIIVSTIMAVAGINIMSGVHHNDNFAGAINSTYAKAEIIKYTSAWDGTNWSTSPSEEKIGEVEPAKTILLDTPSILTFKMYNGKKVYSNESGYAFASGTENYELVWYSVRFKLGDDINRIRSLTQSMNLNGNALVTTPKSQVQSNGVVGYHEYWEQNIFVVLPNTFEVDEGDTSSKESLANKFFKGNPTTNSETQTTKTTSTVYTMSSVSNGEITTFDALEGQFNISYTYAPESGNAISETFSFNLITSQTHDISTSISFKNVDTSLNESTTTVDIRDYNKKNYYQFNQSNEDENNLVFPILTYDPEKFEINYTLTQYNYEETATLKFAKTTTKIYNQGALTPSKIITTAVLTITKSYNNGDPTTTTVYTAETTEDKTKTENNITTAYKVTVDGQQSNKVCVLKYDEGTYKIELSFSTPGLYEFFKKVVLASTPTTQGDVETANYNLYTENDLSTSNENLFKPEALWIYGYTATYADNGVTQKPLYNDDSEVIYLSDFSFLLDEQISSNGFGTIKTDNDSITQIENFDPKKFIDEIGNTVQSNNRVMATTNQAPVIFSANFYLPDYQSTILGYAYNATTDTYFKVNKNTRFTEVGVYYVVMQYTGTDRLTSNLNGENKKYVYQLFAFEIKSSPVQPKIFKNTVKIENEPYWTDKVIEHEGNTTTLSDEIMNVEQYTNQDVYLSWTTNGPFEHQVIVQYYFNSTFKAPQSTSDYSNYTNTTTVGNTTYTALFTQSGYYRFKITSNNNTTGYFGFYIDKEKITNIKAHNINTITTQNADNSTTTTYELGTAITTGDATTALTNKQFAWSWDNKASGAPITAVRYFAPLASITDFKSELLNTNEAITANGQINAFNTQFITYKKLEEGKTLSSAQRLQNAGIYVLCLTDAGGNVAYFTTIFDNTSPSLYVCESGDTNKQVTETTISSSVDIYWTVNKAIKINLLTVSKEEETTILTLPNDAKVTVNSNYFKTYGNDSSWYLTLANNSLNITSSEFGADNNQDKINLSPKNTIFAKLNVDTNTKTVTVEYNDKKGKVLSLDSADAMYVFTLKDELENTAQKTLLLSLDQTILRMFAFDDENKIGANNYREVYSTFGTNKNVATIKWQTPKNADLVIESITIDFYPLLNNLSEITVNSVTKNEQTTYSSNYPYADTKFSWTIYNKDSASDIGYNPFNLADGTGVVFITNAINTTISDDINITKPGKYVVTRTYVNAEDDESLKGDSKTRVYTYFVDRGNTIDATYAKFTLSYGYPSDSYNGYVDYAESFASADKLSHTESSFGTISGDAWNNLEYKVSGNKVSVSFNAPSFEGVNGFKYIPSTISPLEATTLTAYLQSLFTNSYAHIHKIIVCVQFHNSVSNKTTYYTRLEDNEDNNNGYQDLSALQYAFKDSGSYRVMVFDLANSQSLITNTPEQDLSSMFNGTESDGNVTYSTAPNYNVFYFEITDTPPSGTYNSKSSLESNYNPVTSSLSNGNTTQYYTNDDYVMFMFTDPENNFDAQIAYKDVTITATYSKFGKTISTTNNIQLSFDTKNKLDSLNQIGAKVVDQPTLFYFADTNGFKTYYVVLPKSVINTTYNAQLDCTYDITLHYVATTDQNEFSAKTYSSTSQIYIDHTAPYTNLTKLIENDAYLNEIESLYPGTIQYIKTHLDDPDFEFLNHFVFTVNEDFYLSASNPDDTAEARFKIYEKNAYQGTTATVVNSKDYYPENSTSFQYYVSYKPGEISNQDNLDSVNSSNNNFKTYRPFKAGNYYDIIERDSAGNYRVYTIYVTGSSLDNDNSSNKVGNTNLCENEFDNTTVFAQLNLLNNSDNSAFQNYFGLNGANTSEIENEITYSKLNYLQSTFADITTNGNYDNDTTTLSAGSTLYWQIIRYTVKTDPTKAGQQQTILYFPSDDINGTRETSNQIANLKAMLNLGNNEAVLFVNSKADLLATLNSIIIDAYNANKSTTGSKISFEFINKINGNPYYSVSNVLDEGNLVKDENNYLKLVKKGRTIVSDYALTINTRGLDIVNTAEDFIESRGINTFVIKIPASNISTYIEKISLNDDNESLMQNGQLTRDTFSLNQSNKFKFVDNFEVSKTFIYPIDSEYIQELTFKDGSSLNVYNNSTYTFTCGDAQFVYDSNHLSYLNITITDLLTNTVLYPAPKQDDQTQPDDTQNDETQNTEEAEEIYFEKFVGNDGTTTINFMAKKGVYYKYDIEVGSAPDNPTTYTFILYTIFPSVTITDTNGANMLPENEGETLVTSKDLLVGLVTNSQAQFNPHVYLTSDKYTTEIVSAYDTLINENGVYTITFQNDIGKYSLGTITFTRKTYDISIYGVYYNDNNNYISLSKKTQGYNYQYTTTDANGETTNSINIDRYFFLSPNDTAWNNIVILLNENKQLQLEWVDNKNYIFEDANSNTRVYHITGLGGYKINTYFAITRIPSATTEIVSDFRINNTKPLSSNLTQIYPTDSTNTDELKATLTWDSTYKFGDNENQIIKDFYLLELWLNGTYVGSYTSGNLELADSGTYTIQIHDILGQYKTFSAGSQTYTITIYKNIVYNVNQNYPIQNATFNNDVTISVSNIGQYKTDFVFEATRNSNAVEVELVNGEVTFSEAGVYIVKMSGTLSGMGNNVEKLYSEYRFTIISANEARTNYEFNKRSGYTITKLVKDGETLNVTPLYSLNLDANDANNQFGKGKFEITVSVKGEGLIPTMEYTYTIWINNETAILNSTRDWGTASTAPFTLKLNPYVVYTRIGNCYVTVNGQTVLTINEENADQNEEVSYTCSAPGVYVVQMYSQSGNLISSQRVTINEPLNTVAIVLIVLAVVVVVALVLMFVIIRKRQKVK